MKYLFILLTILLFAGCGKSSDSLCMKGEIVAADCCGTLAVNITDGPAIGVKALNYNNVIQLYNTSTADRTLGIPGTVIYFTIRDIKDGDIKPCPLYCVTLAYSPVVKIPTSVSLTSCR